MTTPALALSGVSYRTAPVELRERFSVSAERQAEVLKRFLEVPKIDEAVLISTCNRVEVVASTSELSDLSSIQQELESVFARLAGEPRESLAGSFYHLQELEVVRHVFKVAAGLDSMIIGEPQILGQVKEAYEFAHSQGATHAVLNRLFHRAFGVAKFVRTKTGIGKNAVSVCYAAKELARQIFGELEEAAVVLIGTGEIGTLALKHFAGAGAKKIFVASRSLERAVEVASAYSAIPLTLATLDPMLPQADIIIGCSSVEEGGEPILTLERIRAAHQRRRGAPQFFIDLGVPRNFDQRIGSLEEAFLYDIDDLDKIVRENIDARKVEAIGAELILDDEVKRFGSWLALRSVDRAIADLMLQIRGFKQDEIAKTINRMLREGNSGPEQVRAVLNDLCEALIAKTLHAPLTVLKGQAAEDPSLVKLFQQLFLRSKDEQ